jgi:hypothetical protein
MVPEFAGELKGDARGTAVTRGFTERAQFARFGTTGGDFALAERPQ